MAARGLMLGLAWAALAVTVAVVVSCRTPGMPNSGHFPLVGAHEKTSCSSCHTQGLAVTLPSNCAGCHLPDMPTPHFEGDCGSCHNATAWADATFNHATVPDGTACSSCHEPDRPSGHYAGDCKDCHNTVDWEDATFNHDTVAGTPCATCHEPDRPKPHAEGDCADCHNTTDWEDAIFDHGSLAPGTTCASCHEPDRPSGHYAGDCKDCHNTVDWEDATFDHDPFFPTPHHGVKACISCHPEPEGTASFMCLDCHEHRKSEVDDEHRGNSRYSYDTQRCLDCHPKGR